MAPEGQRALSTASILSRDDVLRLLEEPSDEVRVETAAKVGSYFASGAPSAAEKAIAQDIFRAMVRDAEVRVRQALSETLKESPDLPHDVAKALAGDVAEVALPVIEFSEVLTAEDLVEIIEGREEERQTAVARRRDVSAPVADALVDHGNERVVATLVANDGADIGEITFGRVLERFGDSDAVKTPLVQRTKLPVKIAEKLVTMVSASLRDHLVTHHELPPSVAADLVLESRERATVSLLDPSAKTPDVLALVDQLHKNGRLTPTLIVRALCMGDLTFFETALARRADIPAANAWQLVHDRGDLGLERLFAAAEMPASMVKIARIGVAIAREMGLTAGDDREAFRKVMIERVLTQIDEELDGENLDYLVGKLGRKAA